MISGNGITWGDGWLTCFGVGLARAWLHCLSKFNPSLIINQVLVVQKKVDKAIDFTITYPLDSDLSGG